MDIQTLSLLFILSMVLLLGFAGQIIFRRTSIPDVIWLILFGALLSFFLPAADKSLLARFAAPFGTLALVLILFNAGMGFDLKAFSRSLGRGTLLTVAAFAATVAVTTAFTSLLLGWPLAFGVLLGAILGDSSQAVIVPIVMRMRVSERLKSILTLETTLTDVLVVVGAIAAAQVIATGSADFALAAGSMAYSVIVGLFVALLGALAWLSIEDAVERRVSSHFLMLAVLLLLYVFTEAMGGTGAFTALVFGLALGNIPSIRKRVRLPDSLHLNRVIKNFYSDIDFFVRSFFFVYLGMMFAPADLPVFGVGIALVAALFIARVLVSQLALVGSGLPSYERCLASVMVSRGLASAIVSQLPLAMLAGVALAAPQQAMLAAIAPITLSVVFFSIALNVAGVFTLSRLCERK
jgi:cell volume regulation protein A